MEVVAPQGTIPGEMTKRRTPSRRGATVERLPRLDLPGAVKSGLLPHCRLRYGQVWEDPIRGHRVGVLDATRQGDIRKIMDGQKTSLMIQDPPYNIAIGPVHSTNLPRRQLSAYLDFSRHWMCNALEVLSDHAHLYVWLGADYRDGFQPLPDFMILLRGFAEIRPRSFITLRNQRGYGTQKNWMWIRQELLYYVKGHPEFRVVYTEIPKILKGYYKDVSGRMTENRERSRAQTIRPGNVWVDIQQVFYRMEENVPGCYAQKPLNAIERILLSSSREGDLVVDFFAHSGTTLIAGERLNRRVYTCDVDPIFAEVTIRRLEQYRRTGRTGWQWQSPFSEVNDVERQADEGIA